MRWRESSDRILRRIPRRRLENVTKQPNTWFQLALLSILFFRNQSKVPFAINHCCLESTKGSLKHPLEPKPLQTLRSFLDVGECQFLIDICLFILFRGCNSYTAVKTQVRLLSCKCSPVSVLKYLNFTFVFR